jgi:tetratricopeptide (TPR) repeat protein
MVLVLSGSIVFPVSAQQAPRIALDVSHYSIDLAIIPEENKISAVADVTFKPLVDTRNVTFELNGSLIVETVEKVIPPPAEPEPTPTPVPTPTPARRAAARPQVTITKVPVTTFESLSFVQDRVGMTGIGPIVRVDLGQTLSAGTELTVRFKYSGVLVDAQGGPLLSKRLAFIGPEDGYLKYAARWFPFNDYGADRATSSIRVSIPKEFRLATGASDPVIEENGKFTITHRGEGLTGNLAYGRFDEKNLTFGEIKVNTFTRGINDPVIEEFAEAVGRVFQFYVSEFGEPVTGSEIALVQIDDEGLDFYTAPGLIFISNRFFEQNREFAVERLQREVAYQWWLHTVGLKTFDDAVISQGLAEYSAILFRENGASEARLEGLRRELLEKSLTFEQAASLARAPAALDDQSAAYQYVMFGKGPMVFRLLRETMGDGKFKSFLRMLVSNYRGQNLSLVDFENYASEVHGSPLRYFFARWIEGTGVPEFRADYDIIRTREGKYITRGTVRQNYDNLRLPIDLLLRSAGDDSAASMTVNIDDASADFYFESDGVPVEVVIDPMFKLFRTSEELRISSVARRGIEQLREGNLAEAQVQLEEALKLDRSNGWVYYHLGLLHLQQRNYDIAIDNFKAITQGLRGNSRPPWIHVWSWIRLGNAYDSKGDRTRAVDAYKKAEELGDDYDGAKSAIEKYLATPFDPRVQN